MALKVGNLRKFPFKLCKFPRAPSVGKNLNWNEKFKIDARAPSGDGKMNFWTERGAQSGKAKVLGDFNFWTRALSDGESFYFQRKKFKN